MSTFNELIDFTRSTTGTYLDSVVYGDELVTNGSGKFEGANGTNVYTAYSEWANTYNSTFFIQNNKGRFTPSGGFPAASLTLSGFNSGKTYVITAQAQSNISNKTIDIAVNGTVSTITSNGSQQVIRHEFVSNGSVESFQFRYDNNSGYVDFDNISVKEVIGGQVSGTPLLRTAAINEPRLEYDASGNPLGLLIEEARTNLCPFSESFTSTWIHNNSTLNSGIDSPNGGNNAWSITENTSTSTHQVYYPVLINSTGSGQSFNFSVYVKQLVGNRRIQIAFTGSPFGSEAYATFNINSKAIFTNAAMDGQATIKPVGNGWYRVSASATTNAAAAGSVVLRMWNDDTAGYASYAGDGVSTLGIYGAQLETGAFPTSYIPTSGSTVTRNKDVVSVPVERFGYNTSQATVIVYGKSFLPSATKYLWEIGSGSADRNFAKAYNQQSLYVIANSVNTVNLNAGTFTANNYGKLASALKANSFAASLDGKSAVIDNTGAVQLDLPAIAIGQNKSYQETLNGHIKQIQYYPKRLSNTELQLLTQPSASPTMNLTFDGQATSTLVEGFHD